VAIVGSRACSQSGEARAFRLAGELAQAGVCIVSGLARGIDGAAHRGAIAASGLTAAVLGTGLQHVYPYEHRELSLQVQESGAVVSQFVPGFTGSASSFKKRNYLIAALSQLVVVVEAKLHSGTAHTIKQALAQGRKVGLLRSLVESEGWAAQLAEHHQVFTVHETGCVLERLEA
jgi:DNA processing protein